jgi:hypothetical protein
MKLTLMILVTLFLTSCSSEYEYKTISIKGKQKFGKRTYFQDPVPMSFESPILPKDSIDILGNQGWQLISTYSITETTFPNFGNDEYHTGIKSDVHTNELNLIFIRKK